jgi:hypothetical protein
MVLNPQAIALQGVGYIPLVLAVQGFAEDDATYSDFLFTRRRVRQPPENDEALLLLIL